MKTYIEYMQNVLNESVDTEISKLKKGEEFDKLKVVFDSIFLEDNTRYDNIVDSIANIKGLEIFEKVEHHGIVYLDSKMYIKFSCKITYISDTIENVFSESAAKRYKGIPTSEESAKKVSDSCIKKVFFKYDTIIKDIEYIESSYSSINTTKQIILVEFTTSITDMLNSYLHINRGTITGKKFGI